MRKTRKKNRKLAFLLEMHGRSPTTPMHILHRSLKYSRLGPASSEILIKDTASALAASSRYIVSERRNLQPILLLLKVKLVPGSWNAQWHGAHPNV